MNWDRPVRKIKVKAYKEEIFVDECVADAVLFIDGIKGCKTKWCCCGHRFLGPSTIEFLADPCLDLQELILSKYPNAVLEREAWMDKENKSGWTFIDRLCECSDTVVRLAKEHFGCEG